MIPCIWALQLLSMSLWVGKTRCAVCHMWERGVGQCLHSDTHPPLTHLCGWTPVLTSSPPLLCHLLTGPNTRKHLLYLVIQVYDRVSVCDMFV